MIAIIGTILESIQKRENKQAHTKLADLLEQDEWTTERFLHEVSPWERSPSEEVRALLGMAIQERPRSPALYHALIKQHLLCEEYNKAEYWLQVARKINPLDRELCLDGIEVALLKGEVKSAEERLEQAMRSFPQEHKLHRRFHARLFLLRGKHAWEKDHKKKALFYLKHAYQADREWSLPLIYLSKYMKQMKQDGKALLYESAVKKKEEEREEWNWWSKKEA